MSPTVLDLLTAIRAHLGTFTLPQLCSVNVSIHDPQVAAQLRRQDVPQLVVALLAWADTLTDPTAEVWRVPESDSVHLSITGRLPDGVAIRIYGGMAFTAGGLGSELTPGDTAAVPLASLHHLATPGEVRT